MTGPTFDMYGEGTLATGLHTFTPAAANRALVLIRRVVGDLVDHYHRMLDLQEAADAAEADARLNDELGDLSARMRCCLDELESVGVELRDFARGIVDFPCVAGGRLLHLCWAHGENRVKHWHELGESFAQRRPIATLPSVTADQPAEASVGAA